jgi:hypothetical protein
LTLRKLLADITRSSWNFRRPCGLPSGNAFPWNQRADDGSICCWPVARLAFSFAPRNHSTLTMSLLVACQLPLTFTVLSIVRSMMLKPPAERTSRMSWFTQLPHTHARSFRIGPPASKPYSLI